MTSVTAWICIWIAVVGAASASRGLKEGCDYACPKGFVVVSDGSSGCGYGCVSPANPQCRGSIGQSYQCGGTSGVKCPAIACSTSYASAYSGPGGCARASSAIGAYSFGQVAQKSVDGLIVKDNEICSSTADPVVSASNAAKAYAKAIAATFITYNSYVCSCCVGNSAAYAAVGADVQAVASAWATAVQEAVASVSCYGELLAGASSYGIAIAQDTQLAIDHAYAVYYSQAQGGCTASGLQLQIEQAVAKAVACAFYDVYAAYNVLTTENSAYSCSKTYAIAAPGWDTQCHFSYLCE